MKPRVLFLPLALAAEACSGISITDPSVKVCRDQSYEITMQFSGGRVSQDTLTVKADTTRCRKAA